MEKYTKRYEKYRYLYQRTRWKSKIKRRGGMRDGRLTRNSNVKPERAGAIFKQFAPNPSGAGTPKSEARLPSDCLLIFISDRN
jgi:hypothetical protein